MRFNFFRLCHKLNFFVDKTVTLSHNGVTVKKKIKILEFKIETKSAVPVYEQVKEAVKYHIISGTLVPGDQLMSIRDLASKTKIHPNTIAKVYSQLETEGFIFSQPGKGYFVKTDKRRISKEKINTFKKSVREFVSKSTTLGFGMDEIYKEIKKIEHEREVKASEENNDKTK